MSDFGTSHDHICGCYHLRGRRRVYLAQVKLDTHVTITPVCFTTKLTQTFRHTNAAALDNVRYTFPLYDGVAVTSFVVKVGEKVLAGTVQQKDVARKTYQAAIARHETAGLLEALPSGVFGITVGNVPTKVDVIVEIHYGGELLHDAGIDGLRFTIPTSIAPRYGRYPGEVMTSNAIATDGMNILIDLDMAKSAIRKVESPTHRIGIEMGQNSISTGEDSAKPAFNPSLASISLAAGRAELADDFVVQILIDDIGAPQALLEEHPSLQGQRAIMATLVPKFTLPSITPEIVFIADQSGSMAGGKNVALVSALKVFLKSLPFGVRFNICAFGDRPQFLWPQSQAYNEDNVEKALDYTSKLAARMGGTEMFKPIKETFEKHLSGMPLEVILLTDGEIWGEEEIFNFINEQIRDKKVDARIFTLGIGADASHTLVNGIARAGNGFAQFVVDNEELVTKVMRMLKAALLAPTRDYQLEVHYGPEKSEEEDFELVEKVQDLLRIEVSDTHESKAADVCTSKPATSFFDTTLQTQKEDHSAEKDRYAHLPIIPQPSILQAPYDIPALYPYSRTTVYLLLGPDSPQKPVTSVTLRARSDHGPVELKIPVQTSLRSGTTIHALAARKAIQDLEESRGWLECASSHAHGDKEGTPLRTKYAARFDELVEHAVVQLGLRFQVASKSTSFVAVEDQTQRGQGSTIEPSEIASSDTSRFGRLKRGSASSSNTAGFAPGGSLFGSSSSTARSTSGGSLFGLNPNHAGHAFAGSLFASGPRQAQQSMSVQMSVPSAPADQAYYSFAFQQDVDFSVGGGGTARFCDSSSRTPAAVQPQAMSYGQTTQQSHGGWELHSAPVPPSGSGEDDDEEYEDQLQSLEESDDHGHSFDDYREEEEHGCEMELEEAEEDSRDEDMGFGLFDDDDVPAVRTSMHQIHAEQGQQSQQGQRSLTLHDVIAMQGFSGAWAWDASLLHGIGLDVDSIKKQDLGGEENVAATVLVLAWLQAKHGPKKDVWEMIAAKARAWLEASASVKSGLEVEELLDKAATYFG